MNSWRTTPTYKRWQTLVFKRDGFRCVNCGTQENLKSHHIKPADLHPRLRFVVANGRTLCSDCHARSGARAYKFKPERGQQSVMARFEKALREDNMAIGAVMLSKLLTRPASLYHTPTGSVVLLCPEDLTDTHVERALEIMLEEVRLMLGKRPLREVMKE